MNEHEKALPAGGPAKPTQNAVKIYVISSRERLLLPLAFCFCLLLVNTLLWSGPTAGLTAAVCVWYGLLGLYLGRTLLNTWESRVLLAVNLALAATLALGSNWYFRAWNLLALLALLPVHAIGLSGGQFLPWWRPSMLWERLCLLLWGLFGHLGAALATAWPQKKDGAARRVLPLLLGAAGALALLAVLRRRAVRRRHGGPAGLCLPPLHGRGLEGPAGQRHDPLPLRSAVQSPPPHTPETDQSRSPRRGRRPGLRHRAGGGGGAVPAVPGRPIRRTLRRS